MFALPSAMSVFISVFVPSFNASLNFSSVLSASLSFAVFPSISEAFSRSLPAMREISPEMVSIIELTRCSKSLVAASAFSRDTLTSLSDEERLSVRPSRRPLSTSMLDAMDCMRVRADDTISAPLCTSAFESLPREAYMPSTSAD